MKTSQRKIALAMLALLALLSVLHVTSIERGREAEISYVVPMTALFVGMYALNGKMNRRWEYCLGLALVAWYVFCRVADGEWYMRSSYANFTHFFYMYGMALPFAFLADDEQRRTGLKIVSLILFVSLGIVAWMGVACAWLDLDWVVPLLGMPIVQYTYPSRRLALGYNPNICAEFMLCALLLGLWYATTRRRRWFWPVAAFIGLGLFTAIALTYSRTTMIQFSFVAAGMLVFSILKVSHTPPGVFLRPPQERCALWAFMRFSG